MAVSSGRRRRRVARRVAFSPFATAVLVTAFSISSTPSRQQREKLAEAIGTTERRVQVWFQNRRQRSGAAGAGDGLPLPATNATTVDADDEPGTPPADTYPGGAADAFDDYSDDDSVAGEEQLSDPWMHEGVVKDNMHMEAFTTLFPPFEVMWASGDWLEFCGFKHPEIVGKTLKVLQGPETDADTIVALMDAVARVDSVNLRLTNYTRHGIPFRHDIEVQPLKNSRGEAVLYKVRSRNVTPLLEHGVEPRAEPPTEVADDEGT